MQWIPFLYLRAPILTPTVGPIPMKPGGCEPPRTSSSSEEMEISPSRRNLVEGPLLEPEPLRGVGDYESIVPTT